MMFPATLLLFLVLLFVALTSLAMQMHRDHKAGFDWSSWHIEVRPSGLHWVNAQTAEVLTADEMDKRSRTALVVMRGGREA